MQDQESILTTMTLLILVAISQVTRYAAKEKHSYHQGTLNLGAYAILPPRHF